MRHVIREVYFLEEMNLSVQFAEGVLKIFDVRKLIARNADYAILAEDEELYDALSVEEDGEKLVWGDLSLDCEDVWNFGTTKKTEFDGLLSLADATNLWNLSDSALRKAISYGKLIPGVDVCKFGKQWVVSYEAMQREYGAPRRK
ncbi:MAG: DUF2442 domain-containing protein [Lachnospiraceae bacterium]|nr:DUF2442 domain-containing protein [Lachnospiraceae bacterium]